jgi:hypothetical protein
MLLALFLAFGVQWLLVSLDSTGRINTFGASADALAGEDGPPSEPAPEPGLLARVPAYVEGLAWAQWVANLACAAAVGVFAGRSEARRRVERAWLVVAAVSVALGLLQGAAGASLAMFGSFVSAAGALLARWCSLPEPHSDPASQTPG